MRIISIGEVLWDVIGTEEHLGGAPFNFSAHARRLGHDVRFVSAVGADERGGRVLQRMREFGLRTDYIAQVTDQPTGTVTVTLDASGQPNYKIHRPAAYDFPQHSGSKLDSLLSPPPQWIYYGTLAQTSTPAHALTTAILQATPKAHRFYDVNLRANSYTPELVKELMSAADVVKLNEDEAEEVQRFFGKHAPLESFCRRYKDNFGWQAVCVTRGEQGCVLLVNDTYIEVAGYKISVADTVGAGDVFSAALLHGLASRWTPWQTGDFANRVGALVASRPGAIPAWTIEEALALASS